MMGDMQQQRPRFDWEQDEVEKVISSLNDAFNEVPLVNVNHTLTVDGTVISVRDNKTGALHAYSATQADFKSSLEEFVLDYFVRKD